MIEDENGNYSDPGIVSTTIGKDIKSDIYGDYINYIILPKNTKVLYVEGITATSYDFEVMLHPNARLSHIRDEGEYVKVWKFE